MHTLNPHPETEPPTPPALLADIQQMINRLHALQAQHPLLGIQSFLIQTWREARTEPQTDKLLCIRHHIQGITQIVQAESHLLERFAACVACYTLEPGTQAAQVADQLKTHVEILVRMTQDIINGTDILKKQETTPARSGRGFWQDFWHALWFRPRPTAAANLSTDQPWKTLIGRIRHLIRRPWQPPAHLRALLSEHSGYIVGIFQELAGLLDNLIAFKHMLDSWQTNHAPDPVLIDAAHQIAYHAIWEITQGDVLSGYPARVQITAAYFLQKEICIQILFRYMQHLPPIQRNPHLPPHARAKIAATAQTLIHRLGAILAHQQIDPVALQPILEKMETILSQLAIYPFPETALKNQIRELIAYVGNHPPDRLVGLEAPRHDGRELLELIALNARNHPPQLMNVLRWHHQAALEELSTHFEEDLFDFNSLFQDNNPHDDPPVPDNSNQS